MSATIRPLIDYTNKDYESLRAAMLALAREKLPEWTDQSPNDLGVVFVELLAYMGDILAYYQDRIANESYLDTAVERRSVMNLLRLIGYELRPARPASADLTLIFELPDDKSQWPPSVDIPTGAEFMARPVPPAQPVSFRYVRESLTVNCSELPELEEDPDIDLNRLQMKIDPNKVYKVFAPLPVVQVNAVVAREIVGSSDGSPGQRFALKQQPLLDESLAVHVAEGDAGSDWARCDTLLRSYSADKHYAVRRDEAGVAWVEFGDDKYGRVPPRGHNNITASYQVGGGARGNAASYTICEGPSIPRATYVVFNPRPAAGGADPEPVDEAARRAPQLFRSMRRAVTAADYEAYARQFGIAKVRAYSGGWNYVDLCVAPAGGGYPTDTLKEELRAYFEDKRSLSSIVNVRDPRYVEVFIEGNLEVEPYFYTEQVRRQVEAAVSRLLAFDQVEFGGKLFLSKVYEAIEAVPGVAGVTVVRFARGGPPPQDAPADTPGVLWFAWAEIPTAAYPRGIELMDIKGGQGAR